MMAAAFAPFITVNKNQLSRQQAAPQRWQQVGRFPQEVHDRRPPVTTRCSSFHGRRDRTGPVAFEPEERRTSCWPSSPCAIPDLNLGSKIDI